MIDAATIERLARECIAEDWDCGGRYCRDMDLARFAALIEAHALERAEKVCRDQAEDCDTWDEGAGGDGGRVAANMCAGAIRAL